MTKMNTIMFPQKGVIKAITPETGTAGATWVEVVDLDLRWMSDTTIVIGNTHGSIALDYRVKVFSDFLCGVPYETVSGTVIADDADQVRLVRHAMATVEVQGNGATYNISAISGG